MLMVWDLETHAAGGSPSAGSDRNFLDRPQPTAYAIPFPHPLTSVGSHSLSSKEFLVSDNHGSIFLTDWRSDPEEDPRNLNVVELVEPRALSDAVSGIGSTGAAAWRADNADMYVPASSIPRGTRDSRRDERLLILFPPELAPHTDRGIRFGIFQICKEESRTSAVPAWRKVVTSLGKQLVGNFPIQLYCFSLSTGWVSGCGRVPFVLIRVFFFYTPGGAPLFRNTSRYPPTTLRRVPSYTFTTPHT